MGGNIETPFYALVLWTLRGTRWPFAVVTAIAVAHRELVAYPLAALLALDVVRGAWRSRETWGRWAAAAMAMLVLQGGLHLLRPYAPMFGPDTEARYYPPLMSSANVVGGQICLDTAQWPARLGVLVREHLPLMSGGLPGPLVDLGVSTGVGQGRPGLFGWTLALVLGSLAAAALVRTSRRETSAAPRTAAVQRTLGRLERPHATHADAAPATWLPWFLILSGLVSVAVYTLVSCAPITTHTLRYDLLVAFIPAGAVMAGLCHPARTLRAALLTALLVQTWPAVDDYRVLAGEIVSGRWPDPRGQAATALAARGPAAYRGDFRVADLLTFRGGERFTIAATTSARIESYVIRADAAPAGVIKVSACTGGERLADGVWLCPPGTH